MPPLCDRYAPLSATAMPPLATAMPPGYDRYAPGLRPLCPLITTVMPPGCDCYAPPSFKRSRKFCFLFLHMDPVLLVNVPRSKDLDVDQLSKSVAKLAPIVRQPAAI